MTSRLDELRNGLPRASSVVSGPGDIEAGDPESERLTANFTREVEEISRVLQRSRTTVEDVDAVFDQRNLSDQDLASAGGRLDVVESELTSVRSRLKRIADENKEFRMKYSNRTAVVRARVVQYKQMGEKFIDITRDIEVVRGKHRDALHDVNRQEIMRVSPSLSPAQADAALADGDRGVDSLLQSYHGADHAALQYQLNDIRQRNQEIHRLTKSMAELNNMFVDMSILVDAQQELINNVEYQVEEVKESTKAAQEELVTARQYQKSRNKKKMWCWIISIVIILVVAAAIIVPLGRRFGWFSSGSNNNSNNNNNNNNGGTTTSGAATGAQETTGATAGAAGGAGGGQSGSQGERMAAWKGDDQIRGFVAADGSVTFSGYHVNVPNAHQIRRG